MHEVRIKICFIHKYIQLSYNQIYLFNYKNKNLLKNSLTTDHHARNYIIKKVKFTSFLPSITRQQSLSEKQAKSSPTIPDV